RPVNSSFMIDQHGPMVACPSPSPSFALGSTASQVTASVSATASGPLHASVSVAAAANAPGVQRVSVTREDKTGNTTRVSCSYLVGYKILGFFSPLPKSSAIRGQTIAVKIALADENNVRISDAAAAALASTCSVKFSASGGQTQSPACMSYDNVGHQFKYDWTTTKTGTVADATLTV